MNFSIRPVDFQQTEVALRYVLPNGEHKIVCQRVTADLLTQRDVNAQSNLIAYVKDALKDKAEKDVKDYVRQHAQEGRGLMPTLYDDNGTAGAMTGWYDVATNAGTSTVPYATYRYAYEYGYRGSTVISPTPTQGENYDTSRVTRTKIVYNDGKRKLIIEKDVNFEIEITPEDIQQARINYWKGARINIISKRAETKAEELLKMFISDIDFRNYQEKGFFTVKSGNRIFKIHKDTHKHIDMYEKEGELFVPRNRLCTHTENRELPRADEAFQKLMLIRSNKVIEHSNLHGASDLKPVRELEELLV
jgi:hypothetical protein